MKSKWIEEFWRSLAAVSDDQGHAWVACPWDRNAVTETRASVSDWLGILPGDLVVPTDGCLARSKCWVQEKVTGYLLRRHPEGRIEIMTELTAIVSVAMESGVVQLLAEFRRRTGGEGAGSFLSRAEFFSFHLTRSSYSEAGKTWESLRLEQIFPWQTDRECHLLISRPQARSIFEKLYREGQPLRDQLFSRLGYEEVSDTPEDNTKPFAQLGNDVLQNLKTFSESEPDPD